MPNVWTHILYGQNLMKQSGITFGKEQKVFNLGTQGPDPFFYYHFWPWKKDKKEVVEIGSLIHKQYCGSFLIRMIESIKSNPAPELRAYVFGFLSHHILDRNTHPYIVYRSGEEGNKHQKLEIYIDTLLMKELRGIETWKVPVYQEIDIGKNLSDSIQEMMDSLLREIHGINREDLKNIINKSYQDMITALKVLADPTGIKNKILGERIAPFSYTKNMPNTDFLNKLKQEWIHPADRKIKSTESFYEILDRAGKEGVSIFQAIDQFLKGRLELEEMKILIGDISYETGLPCNSPSKNKYFDPLL